MSEICSNCEIFNTGRSMELISANLTLFLTVLSCVEVRRCPHSGVGRDFLLHWRITFTKTVQNLRLGPPAARSTFVPLCSNRLGPPEPSDRHFGQLGLFLGRFWALEVPNLTNFVSGKWNEARGTLRVEKNKPVDPNGKKNFGPPPFNPLWAERFAVVISTCFCACGKCSV